ncbi:MAG: tetratricopeptide repeat protein, partial [Planctomycetes bacterium]|nr:tetratricopeptide repeat protein [Planctomycetota bacterium]
LDNPNAPLGSVELLLSPSQQLRKPNGEEILIEPATFQNTRSAFERWDQRCDTSRQNVALFYFCGHGVEKDILALLMQDFWSQNSNPWLEAVDFSSTYNGMAVCQAQTQCYFIDTCREVITDVLNNLHFHPPALKATNAYESGVRTAPILYATAFGRSAFGGDTDVSHFTKALLSVLKGEARDRQQNRWVIHTDHVGPTVRRVVARNSLSLPSSEQQHAVSDGESAGEGRVLHFLPDADGAGTLPSVWNLPHLRNPHFTGREECLEYLAEGLQQPETQASIAVISGLGGIGKTQVAMEFAFRHAAAFQVIWWIDASSPLSLGSSYADLATELSIVPATETDHDIRVRAVRHWLERYTGWLLVFDNASDEAAVRKLLPRNVAGQVIITSQKTHWTGVKRPFPLLELSRDESMQLLRQLIPSGEPSVLDNLADELGDLALALVQAAGYIRSTAISVDDYLQRLSQRRSELWKHEHPPTDYNATITTTWNIALEQLSPEARELLWLCSFFDAESVPRSLLQRNLSGLPGRLTDVLSDQFLRDAAVADLQKNSLVSATQDDLSMHRLLQAVVRDSFDDESRGAWSRAAMRVITDAYSYDELDPSMAPAMVPLVPHVVAVAEHVLSLNEEASTVGKLLADAALSLRQLGRFVEAKNLLERVVEITTNALPKNHPDVATGYSNLALVEQDLGNLAEARSLLRNAMDINGAAYAHEHVNVATCVSNLALVEKDLGNVEEARRLLRIAVDILERLLRPDDPMLASKYTDLAMVERHLGESEVALQLSSRAVQILRSAFGAKHPVLIVPYSNLALVYQDIEDFGEAKQLLSQVLEICNAIFSTDHPVFGKLYTNLASVERKLGDLDRAYTLLQQAIKVKQAALPQTHPTLANSYCALAVIEQELNKPQEARQSLTCARDIMEDVVGTDHPNLATIYNNLACVEQELENWKEARDLMRRSFEIRRSKLGEHHPLTKGCAEWLRRYDPDFSDS